MAKKTADGTPKAPTKVIYPEIEMHRFDAFTVEKAQEILDMNFNNRPRSSTLTKRYALEMLHRKWKMNGETVIVSRTGVLLSGQHRLEAVIKAEEMRLKNPAYWREHGWRTAVTVPILMVTGVDDKVADTLDLGKSRTHGDVLYRMGLFDDFVDAAKEPLFTVADKKKLARDLATAIRTVWLRVGGQDVADAPKFPQSEMLDFLGKHPKILDAVVFVYNEDNGPEARVKSMISRAYLAAGMYLMGAIRSDRELYDTNGDVKVDDRAWELAEGYVSTFASGVNLDAGDPILSLRQTYQKQMSTGGTRDRDEVLGLLIKSMVAFVDEEKMTFKELQLGPDEKPRLGGLDSEPTIDIVDPTKVAKEQEVEDKPKKKGTKKAAPKKGAKKATKKAAPKKPAKKKEVEPEEDEDFDDEDEDGSDN